MKIQRRAPLMLVPTPGTSTAESSRTATPASGIAARRYKA